MLVYWLLRLVVGLFWLLPFWLVYALSSLVLYPILYYVVGYRRRVVRENLQLAFPQMSEAARRQVEKKFYKYLSDLFLESIKGLSMSDAQLRARWKITTIDLVRAYLDAGKSVILAGSHYGNWEWGAKASSLHLERPVVVIYKPIRNPHLEAFVKGPRSNALTTMAGIQETGQIFAQRHTAPVRPTAFALLGDQSPSNLPDSHVVDFFGIPTYTLPGIAKYAQQYDLPIVAFRTVRVARGYYEIHGEVLLENPREHTAQEISQLYMRRMQTLIESDPVYWLWSHRRWKHRAG